MAILIRRWPIVNLFFCNYICVCVWGGRKCAHQRCLDSCLCAVRERLNEALNYLAAWVSSGTQHVFLIAPELVGDDTHRELTPENSGERGLAKRAADLITTKLLFSITLLMARWVLPICTNWVWIISDSVRLRFNLGPAVSQIVYFYTIKGNRKREPFIERHFCKTCS